jgi:hypothetical protein
MKTLVSILGLVVPILVCAQTQTAYYPVLPDTLFPCRTYSEYRYGPIPKRTASSPFTAPDTFQLRLNSNVIRFIASNDFSLAGFELNVPCQSKAGVYSVYNPTGEMQAQRKIVVADPKAYGLASTILIKKSDFTSFHIEEEPKQYGSKDILVGAKYPLLFESKTLLFGNLPDTGGFKQSVDSIALVSATEFIPIRIDSIPNPFQAHGFSSIPFGITPKPFHLLVRWKDGTQKVCSTIARTVTRKAPVVKEIKPETLGLGAITQLAITGDDLRYVNAGTYVSLDRASILNAFVKSGNTLIPAYGFPDIAPSGTGVLLTSGILAQFQVPKTFPTGPADLLIQVSGRNDTSLFPNVLQIADRPIIINHVSPNMWGRTPLKLTAKLLSILPTGSQFKIALRKNSTPIFGNNLTFSSDRSQISAEFPIGPNQDTGFYDLELSNLFDVTLTLANAVHIFPPQLTGNAILIQRGEPLTSIPITTRFPLFSLLDTSTQVSGSLCRQNQCIPLASVERIDNERKWKASANLPASTDIGLYDLKFESKTLGPTFLFPQSVIVYAQEQQVLVPNKVEPDTVTKAFFTYEVGKPYQWNYGTPCNQTVFTPIEFPTDAELKIIYAVWTPTLADTGMRSIEVKAPDSCGGKNHIHYVNVVPPSQTTSLTFFPTKSPAKQLSNASPHLVRHGSSIKMVWPHANSGQLQLFSLNGRLLASQTFSPGGFQNWTWNTSISTGETVFLRWVDARAFEQGTKANLGNVTQVFRLRVP